MIILTTALHILCLIIGFCAGVRYWEKVMEIDDE